MVDQYRVGTVSKIRKSVLKEQHRKISQHTVARFNTIRKISIILGIFTKLMILIFTSLTKKFSNYLTKRIILKMTT